MDATPYTTSSTSTALDSPSSLSATMARRWTRKLERYCCTCVTYFPLAFVYSMTSWAAYVDVSLSTTPSRVTWLGRLTLSPVVNIAVAPANLMLRSPHRSLLWLHRRRSLPPRQLVLHIRCLHFAREHHQRVWLQYPPHTSAPYCHLLHRQVQWRIPVLQKVPGT